MALQQQVQDAIDEMVASGTEDGLQVNVVPGLWPDITPRTWATGTGSVPSSPTNGHGGHRDEGLATTH